MKDVFLDFSFESWPSLLLSLFPAFINISIFIYVLFFVRKSTLSTSFLFFLLTLIMWRMQEVVLQICATKRSAEMWYHMFSISTNFIGATGLHFVLVLINKGKWREKNYHLVALYLPTFLFSMFFASGVEYMTFNHTKEWGWVFIPSHPVSIAAFVLIGIHASLMLILLSVHTWRLRQSKSIQFKRLRIILLGSATPIIIGCIYQILLPIFFNYTPVPVASSATIFFSFSILIAITKYNLLDYSPSHQWESIVENMNEGILIVDNNNIIQYVNNKFCEMLGYSRTELINKRAMDIFALPEGKAVINKMIERRKKLFQDKYEMVMKRKDGKSIVCEINAQPYLDQNNRVIGSVGIHTDVTQQREATKKLKASENRYRSFVEQATDGIFIADLSGKFKDANTRLCDMLGYPKEQLLRLGMKDVLFEEDLRATPLRIAEFVKGRSYLTTRTVKQKSGAALPTEINTRLLPDGQLLGIVRDISERKRTEEDLLEKVNEMDAFIYRASHDLRGPLASITGLTNLGKEEIKDKQAAFFFNKIHDSVARLDDILQELSKIARVTQAKVEPVEIDLKKEIDDILNSLRHLPNYAHIEFIQEINTTKVFCDKILLIIILQNLIINAINYYDEKKEKPFLRIKTSENVNGIKIVLTDNGVGIPADIQEKVYDMFYRGNNTSKGSGLGLYIVKNAVKKLNGSIHLSSKEGEGTTFTLTFSGGG
jgi:PAS domain S-box-containing protein